MSLLIKGFDPPTDCKSCLISSKCSACKISESKIPDECPIIEIPTPHGNLIDEDEIYDDEFNRISLKEYDRTIIIEAEPGREKLSMLLHK